MSRELLMTADALAREKNLPIERVLTVLEKAFEKMLRKREFGDEKAVPGPDGVLVYPRTLEKQIHVHVDRSTGLAQATMVLADGTEEELDVKLDRITATAVKQRFWELLKTAQKEFAVDELLTSGDRLLRGSIRAIKKGDVIVEILPVGVEAVIPRAERTPGVEYKIGETVEAYWLNAAEWDEYLSKGGDDGRDPMSTDVRFDRRVVLSVRSKEWLKAWLEREVEEISNGSIVIEGIARKAGIRAKVALRSEDPDENPVQTVRGFKGSRWKRLAEMLMPEQIDFVVAADDPVEGLIAAMDGVQIQNIAYDEDKKTIDVAIATEHMPLAVGKGGVNLALISELLGVRVRAHDPDMWDQREAAEVELTRRLFVDGLNLDDDTAIALMEAGVATVEEIAYMSMDEALDTGIGDEAAWTDLQVMARAWLEDPANDARWLAWSRLAIPSLDILAFQDAGVLTVQDLADLSVDEALDVLPEGFDAGRARRAVMAARDVVYFHEDEAQDTAS